MPSQLPNDRERLRDLLGQALDLDPGEQRAFLERHLAEGPALDDALELLVQAQDLGGFLETSVVEEPSFEPALPERIGTYRVERVLGWGAMGVVYLAWQSSPRRAVALKVLRLDAASENAARRLSQEGELLARLSHPGIAGIIEMGWTDLGAGRQPFLAMDFVDGQTITAYAESEELDRPGRIRLLRQVAESVAHAHEHGVLHRDLKPENVLVSREGRTTVLDFGVAQVMEEADLLTLTATGQIVGTVAYMAPEQARGNLLDARADQFALGAMLHELLTGDLPFDIRGKLPHEALRIVADADWRPPTRHDGTLTPDLEAVLATVLAPEPVRRYPSVSAFVEDLRRLEAGRPVEARAPGGWEILLRFVRRHRRSSALAAISLVLIGGLLAWGFGTLFNLKQQESLSRTFMDRALLRELEQTAAGLWPGVADSAEPFDAWLAKADELVGRLPLHVAAAEASQDSDDWKALAREDLLIGLADLVEGLVPEIQARRDMAAYLGGPLSDEHAREWRAAADRVAGDARFDGLELVPQRGLVPLGPDPDSGLEEFALYETGDVPGRMEGSGRLDPRPGDALVFVLIPGEEAWIGAQSVDPQGPNFVPGAPIEDHEGPPVRIQVSPFLLSKYEMTQAQWMRCFGENPSDWEIGSLILGITIGPLHPVESVSYERARPRLARLGLVLPTEAQWELAARGGGAGAYLGGDDPADLKGYGKYRGSDPGPGDRCHGPVGSHLPNGYGLHDMLGNVWELCLDDYKVEYHLLDHDPGTGRVVAEPDGDVSRRGTGCSEADVASHLYRRQMRLYKLSDSITGLRPALPLRPAIGGRADNPTVSPKNTTGSEGGSR